jgi:apolipoprotein N-acyltransferase
MFWLGTIYWLIHVTLPGLILLVLYLALYFGVFGLIITSYQLPATSYQLLLIPSTWVILEYLRSRLFTGFGWGLLGYSQYLNLSIIQIADITGVWGVSFLVMMTNTFIYGLVSGVSCHMHKKERILLPATCCLLPIFLIFLTLVYGYYKLYLPPAPCDLRPVRVSVIQGNIPQELKWQRYSQEFILDRYIKISEEATFDKPDLVIWPEAAVPGFLLNREDDWIFQNVFNLAKKLKTNLLIGSVVKEDSGYFNSAILIDPEGKIIRRYNKLHLVPFGEYIPLRKMLVFLETVVPIGDFTAGKDYTIFKIPNPNITKSQLNPPAKAGSQIPNSFSVLICFEDLFPELSRRFTEKGAGFLVNITNDAWFGETSSPLQHVGLSVFRALENRRPLIRAANTGVSCFIAPSGKIGSLITDQRGKAIFVTGYATGVVYANDSLTIYTRYGDIVVLICLILVVCGIIYKYATSNK